MDLDRARDRLVDGLVEQGVLRDARVERALRRVPRHLFVPPAERAGAYADAPHPLPEGQTVSAPHMVALMCEALDLRPGQRVLEVGGGSGYHAAVLAELVAPGGTVLSVERHASLARTAAARLRDIPLAAPVRVLVGDGSEGLPAEAPFDRISVAAAAPAIPPPLTDQLAPGGVLVIPVGAPDMQTLLRVAKDERGGLGSAPLCAVRFVPLLGRHGFPE